MKRSCEHLQHSEGSEKSHRVSERVSDEVVVDSNGVSERVSNGVSGGSLQKQRMELDTIESHPDYLAELKVIEKVRQRRLGEAERNKSMQIKNIHALYAFEVENIEAGVKLACKEAKDFIREGLLDSMAKEEAKLEEQAFQLVAKAQAEAAAAAAIDQGTEFTAEDVRDRRRTRSLSLDFDQGGNKCNEFEETLADLRKANGSLASERLASIPIPSSPAAIAGMPNILLNRKFNGKKSKIFSDDILQNSLTDEDVRSDFMQIVHHLEDRAMAILNSEKEILPSVEATVNDDEVLTIISPPLAELNDNVGGSRKNATTKTAKNASLGNTKSTTKENLSMQYRKGSMVVVRSSTSAEDLSGTVTVVSAARDDVVVRMHTGPRIRVPLEQVRSGRVTIARDVGAYRDMALIMAARSRYGSEQEGLTA